jgi:hypothetical protein
MNIFNIKTYCLIKPSSINSYICYISLLTESCGKNLIEKIVGVMNQKNINQMFKNVLVILLLLPGIPALAQKNECKVLKPEISGTYEGGCKKGLAQGTGVAQGIDRYEGQFNKGLPDGKGTYRWENGIYYEGQWKGGLREGKGKMVYPDSVVTGFWKEDKYVGLKLVAPYRVVSSISITRFNITKTPDKNDRLRLRIMQGGVDNISIQDFSMIYNSGSESHNGNYYYLENVKYPLNLKIRYRSWNLMMTAQSDVTFEILINDPGSWDLTLYN